MKIQYKEIIRSPKNHPQIIKNTIDAMTMFAITQQI